MYFSIYLTMHWFIKLWHFQPSIRPEETLNRPQRKCLLPNIGYYCTIRSVTPLLETRGAGETCRWAKKKSALEAIANTNYSHFLHQICTIQHACISASPQTFSDSSNCFFLFLFPTSSNVIFIIFKQIIDSENTPNYCTANTSLNVTPTPSPPKKTQPLIF